MPLTESAINLFTDMANKITVKAGDNFGRWTYSGIERSVLKSGKPTYQLFCRCACGTEKFVLKSSLINGSNSCGCLQKEVASSKKKIIPSGEKYGRWKVIKELYSSKDRIFLCKCDCGTEKSVKLSSLKNGRSKSCGCYHLDLLKATTPHNKTHGMSKGSRFYAIWAGMISRCRSKKGERFHKYGKFGVSVCERWGEFMNFKKDMYEGYLTHKKNYGEQDTTIDRINPFGNYEPQNCRWATRKEQVHNRRKNYVKKPNLSFDL